MKKNKKNISFFATRLAIAVIIVILGSVFIVYNQYTIEQEIVRQQQAEIVSENKRSIELLLQQIESDIGVLSSYSELKAIANLESRNPAFLARSHAEKYNNLIDEFSIFSKFKTEYNQIRFIEENGQEVIRVNRDGNNVYTTPINELQNKQDRYYFYKTFDLEEQDIYLSKIDLNIEKNRVETPYLPMLRVATPVFDTNGLKKRDCCS